MSRDTETVKRPAKREPPRWLVLVVIAITMPCIRSPGVREEPVRWIPAYLTIGLVLWTSASILRSKPTKSFLSTPRVWMLITALLGALSVILLWFLGGLEAAFVMLWATLPITWVTHTSLEQIPASPSRRAVMFASATACLGALQYLWLYHHSTLVEHTVLGHVTLLDLCALGVSIAILGALGAPVAAKQAQRASLRSIRSFFRDERQRAKPVSFVLVAIVVITLLGLQPLFHAEALSIRGQKLMWEDISVMLLTLFTGGLMRLVCVDLQDMDLDNAESDPQAKYRRRMDAVLELESTWYTARDRARASHDRVDTSGEPDDGETSEHEAGSPGSARRPQLGLALSGGGIRAATVALGFARALGTRQGDDSSDETWLQRIDVISSVSGGGWLASALTARHEQETAKHRLPPADKAFWQDLTDALRDCGDYLARGGIGFTRHTIGPVVAIFWGAALNLLAVAALACSFLVTLGSARAPRIEASGAAPTLLSKLLVAFDHLTVFYLPTSSPLHRHLFGINVIPQLLSFVLAIFALALLLMVVGHWLSDRVVNWATKVAGALAVALMLLAAATLAIRGSVVFTWLMIGVVLLVAVATVVPKLTRTQLAAVLGAVTLGSVSSLLESVSSVVEPATSLWHSALVEALLWPSAASQGPFAPAYTAGAALFFFFLFGILITRNNAGMHAFWRNQISRAYLSREDTDGRDRVSCRANAPLTDLPIGNGPLHILNCTVNTPGSKTSRLRNRGTARFEVSPLCVGGPVTGWSEIKNYPELSLAKAAAISAAAVNSQGGHTIPVASRALIALLNLGLGVWMLHPYVVGRVVDDHRDLRDRLWPHFWTYAMIREVLGHNTEEDPLVFVSDGGHHDNLGVSALVARGCRTVICLDAAADPGYDFSELARVVRLLGVDDQHWQLEGIDVDDARPEDPTGDYSKRLSNHPILVGTFVSGTDRVDFIYVKTSLVDDVPLVVEHYARLNPTFPQQSTADQFFDEAQFEAYSQLGEHLGKRVKALLDRSNLS